VAAQVMRRILVDHARQRKAARRGGDHQRTDMSSAKGTLSAKRMDDVLLVDELLGELETADPRQAEIVRLRFFAGFTVPEVAEALGAPVRAIEAEWTMIRAMLRARIGSR
jgi:RNA polymerase sigma factor (TIGR02999 family)